MAPRSFLEALEDKYADSNVSSSGCVFVMNNMDVAGASGKVCVPREMSLNACGITHAGDMDKIAEICGQVTSLDLAQNNIADWSQIVKLLSCMPRVSFLNLSGIDLSASHTPTSEATFPSLKKLVLNDTSVRMDTVSKLLSIFPNVDELHLCFNGYTTIDCPGVHASVNTILMNGNKMSDFSEVLKMSDAFPGLQQLLLLKNPISQLPEPEALTESFKCLSSINVSESSINCWSEVEKFRHFPALVDIRIKTLPLYKDMNETLRRQLTISYLPNITRLNLSDVSGTERETAERMFIRHCLEKKEKPARLGELEKKHGQVHKFAEIELKPETRKTVEIHFEEKVTLRIIDVTQTVGDLKKQLAKDLAECKACDVTLYHENITICQGATRLGFMNKKLYTLPIDDGDKIYLDVKPK